MPPEILTERTPDGGLLMTATKERLGPTVPERRRRLRVIAETMVARTVFQALVTERLSKAEPS